MKDLFTRAMEIADREMEEYLKEDAFGKATEALDEPKGEEPEFVYSLDEEIFYDDLDEVMDMVNDDMDNEPGDRVVIYRGNPVKVTHSNFIKDMDLIGLLQEMAYEEDGEMAEDYLTDVTDEDEEFILDMITAIMNKKAKQPKYFRVENIQPMTVTVGGIEE